MQWEGVDCKAGDSLPAALALSAGSPVMSPALPVIALQKSPNSVPNWKMDKEVVKALSIFQKSKIL